MIGRAAIALISIAAPASLALGYWQGQSSDLDVPMAPMPINAPIIAKPGDGAVDAVRYLASINGDARPAAPAATPKVEAGGPQLDIAVQFRRDVTAVLTGDDPHVVLSGGKQLGAGEIYRDGWKIRDLSSQRATLTKGAERRDVDLFSAPPMEVQVASSGRQSSGAPLLTGPIELTNGMTAEQRAALQQAQRTQMMQLLQQAMRGGAFPGGTLPGGAPGGGRNRPNGGFGGPGGAAGNFTPDPSQFRQGFGGRPRQGAGAPPSSPTPPATTPDSGNGQPE